MRPTQKVPSEMGPAVSVTDPTGATQLDPPTPTRRKVVLPINLQTGKRPKHKSNLSSEFFHVIWWFSV